MSDTTNDNDDTETSVLESVDTEELLEGTKLEDAVDDDTNLGEAIGRALGAIIGRQIGELIGRTVTERLTERGEDETHELTVSIEDDAGDPVERTTVTVERGETGLLGGVLGSGGTENGETDDDGEVTFELEDGAYAVSADAGDASAEDSVTIEGDDEAVSLTIEEDEDEEDDAEGGDEKAEDDEDEDADESGEDAEGENEDGDDGGDGDENDENEDEGDE